MGLKFVVSEAQARSTQASQASGQAQQAAAALQQSIQAFLSAPLSSKAYDSAKNYFMVAYTPICQSIIMTGEALANAHKKFLSEYLATVNGSDLDEDQLVAEIDNYKALLDTIDDLIRDAKTHRTNLERRSMNAYQAMQKRQEKLEKFREYSGQSASFFSDYEASQSELNNGLAQVQDCKAWNASTGSFDITRLDMTWAKPINDRWEKREKMKQEELKKAEATKANTLAEHGLTEADLVQPNDPESVVLEKYIRLAQMGVNPHTGLPITDEEKWKFQYAAHSKTVFDALGTVGGAYAGQYAANNGFYGKIPKEASGFKFGDTEKLEAHFSKHGGEFGSAFSNSNEYLAGANAVIKNGTKVQYSYKGELRTGYVKFMKNSSLTNANGVPIKSYAKFEFVGTNNLGEITTYHVESGKTFWKMMNNGQNIPIINPIE